MATPILLLVLALFSSGFHFISAQNFTCLDLDTDLEESFWVNKEDRGVYYPSVFTAPELPDTVTGNGFYVFQGNTELQHQGFIKIRGPDEGTDEFLYVKYIAYRPANVTGAFSVLPSTEGSLASDETLEWKEQCVPLLTNQFQRKVVTTARAPSAFFIIDEIIHAWQLGFNCSSATFEEIRSLCHPATTAPPATTSTAPDSTITPPDTTTDPPPDTTDPPSTTTFTDATTPDVSTLPPAPLPNPITEWIDALPDYENSEWSRPSSLRYAATTDDLPDIFAYNLTGSGIFYFQGADFLPNQAILQSAHLREGGDAYLFIRYYVHHKSSVNDQFYYIFPVLGRPQGLQYLDTTANLQWKEVFVQLDTFGSFPVEVGLNTRDPQDFLLIDRIVFVYRQAI